MRAIIVLLIAAGALAARPRATSPMDAIAERYVKLVLAVGQHDADYVDAYYGPAEWKTEAERRKTPLADIDAAAEAAVTQLPPLSDADRRDELASLRHTT